MKITHVVHDVNGLTVTLKTNFPVHINLRKSIKSLTHSISPCSVKPCEIMNKGNL